MPVLDIKTILVCGTLLNMLLCLSMFMFWRSQKTYPGFAHWIACEFLIALTYLLVILRGIIPDFFSIVLMNSLAGWAAFLRFEGIRRFVNAGDSGSALYLVPFCLLAASGFFTYVYDSAMIRNLIVSPLMAFFVLWASYLLLKKSDRRTRILYWSMAALLSAWAAIAVVRTLFWFLAPATFTILSTSFSNVGFFLATIIHDVGITIFFLVLNSHRLWMELEEAQVELQQMATTDALTGVMNRRKFFADGESEIRRAARLGSPFVLAMFDLDHFKGVNDRHGHAAGDGILKHVTDICRKNLRQIDTIGRIGGEEFVIIMPGAELSGAMIMAERLRQTIGATPLNWEGTPISITVSIGVAEYSPADRDIEQLLQRADTAMYQAKSAGRNRVVAAAAGSSRTAKHG